MFNGQQLQLLCYSSRLVRNNETERGTSQKRMPPSCISGTINDTGVHRHKTEPVFIQDRAYSFDLKTGSTYKHTNTHTYMLASE